MQPPALVRASLLEWLGIWAEHAEPSAESLPGFVRAGVTALSTELAENVCTYQRRPCIGLTQCLSATCCPARTVSMSAATLRRVLVEGSASPL